MHERMYAAPPDLALPGSPAARFTSSGFSSNSAGSTSCATRLSRGAGRPAGSQCGTRRAAALLQRSVDDLSPDFEVSLELD
jgi:hypothetical protein